MKAIRITNVDYLNSVPYKPLQRITTPNLSSVCAPAECARRLIERETDLALIPVAEWSRSLEFIALNYGIVAKSAVQSVVVLSEQPFETLETIAVDTSSYTSALLLRVLLLEYFPALASKVSLFRASPNGIEMRVQGTCGALVIGDLALKLRGRFPYITDLAEVWRKKTKTPFVFALWAAPSDIIEEEMFHPIEQAILAGHEEREELARQWAVARGIDEEGARQYVNERISYEITPEALKGLRKYLRLGAKYKLLPEARIDEEQIPGTSLRRFCPRPQTLSRIIDGVLRGARLSLRDGTALAEKASLGTLTLLVERLELSQHRIAPQYRSFALTNLCEVRYQYNPRFLAPGNAEGELLSIERAIAQISAGDFSTLSLSGGITPELNLSYYDSLLRHLSKHQSIRVRALSAEEVVSLQRERGGSVEDLLSEVKQLGVGELGGASFHLLLDKYRSRSRALISGEQWMAVHRSAHGVGLPSCASILFGFGETWRERLIHLSKIRLLQDESGGVTSFFCEPLKPGGDPAELLRMEALSRIFLDNIPRFEFARTAPFTPPIHLGELTGSLDSPS